MKTKTSVTLSSEHLKRIDREIGDNTSRSAFIEAAVRAFLLAKHRELRDDRDRWILDSAAEELNAEAVDVLDFQTKL